MTPVEPRDDGRPRLLIAKDQPEYLTLPATVSSTREVEVTSEWELSAEERATLLAGGRVQLKLWTFGEPLQPIQLLVLPAPQPLSSSAEKL